jgi:hypothetical protein
MAIGNLYYFNILDLGNDGIFHISVYLISPYIKYMAKRFERDMMDCDNGFDHGYSR